VRLHNLVQVVYDGAIRITCKECDFRYEGIRGCDELKLPPQIFLDPEGRKVLDAFIDAKIEERIKARYPNAQG
jgi:hypothetical protein